jgi:hypothetical protein
VTDAPTANSKYALQLQNGGTQYYNDDEVRYVKEGTSGADEALLSAEGYAQVQDLKRQWEALNAQGLGNSPEAQALHAQAEAIRAKAGYSGDTATRGDGGGYTPLGSLGTNAQGVVQNPNLGAGAVVGGNSQQALLDQWQRAAMGQAAGRVDYAVNQGVTELQRALEDAQALYKSQAEAAAKDEVQALDNAALYAEARGDKGGIGHSQYNEIQAAAAQNRLAVQQAQTKLSTDTARQIADLRAQGEFEKADKVLEITQQYLSQLISLEQWAAEFGLSQQQFQANLSQWEREFNFAVQQYTDGLAQTKSDQLADIGSALLSNGIALDKEQLAALGMSEGQMNEMLMKYQLERAAYEPTLTWPQVQAQIEAGNLTPNVLSAYRYYMGAEYDGGGQPPVLDDTPKALAGVRADLHRIRANGATAAEMWHELDSLGLNEEVKVALAEEFGLLG